MYRKEYPLMKTSYYIKYANDDYSINKKHLLDIIKSMEDYDKNIRCMEDKRKRR